MTSKQILIKIQSIGVSLARLKTLWQFPKNRLIQELPHSSVDTSKAAYKNLLTHMIGILGLAWLGIWSVVLNSVYSPVNLLLLLSIPLIYRKAGMKIGWLWTNIHFLTWLLIGSYITLISSIQTEQLFSWICLLLVFVFFGGLYRYWYSEKERMQRLLLQKERYITDQEKMAFIGQMTAGIAHEINNPISVIRGSAEALRLNMKDLSPIHQKLKSSSNRPDAAQIQQLEKLKEKIDFDYVLDETQVLIQGISRASNRASEIIAGLRYVSYHDKDNKEQIDIHEMLDAALNVLRSQYKHRDIKIIRKFNAPPTIRVFPGSLNQVFLNIISNAIQAIEGQGHIILSTRKKGNELIVQIEDNGSGMNEAVKAKIFQPFFTTKAIGKGTGLGLSISYGIIRSHGGTIAVDSSPGQGTIFSIRLPI
jgi:signal transduction histidine kinase